ncbi:MAG: PQQ-dependent sugar dehydrogenase [Gammaproteobacteria bacterium]|nr:PQQ-dependent sugar dehydrogenase [Gammaproteobacteria bacterium]
MNRIRSKLVRAGVALALAAALPVLAQQNVPFNNGIPVAPEGISHKPLGTGPFDYQTAEGQNIRVEVLTRDVEFPYSMAFLPDGTMLIAERAGRLRIFKDGKLDPRPVQGAPQALMRGEPGLPGSIHGYLNVAVHPDFARNHLIYIAYTKALDAERNGVAVARARLEGDRLTEVKDVLSAEENLRGATALALTTDGKLWIATSASSGDGPQRGDNLGGKVLRLNDDGSIPDDNPFVGLQNFRGEIYTLGHRSSLGLTVHAPSQTVYLSEMGPNGGDEINVIAPGRNYGWPLVSYGRTYQGPWQSSADRPGHAGYEPPSVYWTPSISVSGLNFYTGDKLPKWRGDLFVAGLRYGEIPGTGRVDRILFNQDMQELRRETLLDDLGQRIRDVKQGPDGYLYVSTDEKQGAIMRIGPR